MEAGVTLCWRDQCQSRGIEPLRNGGQHAGVCPLGMELEHMPSGVKIIIPAEAAHRSQFKTRGAAFDAMEMALLSLEIEL